MNFTMFNFTNGTFVLSTLLSVEKDFRGRETQRWYKDRFWLLWCIAAFYVVAAHAGRRWMDKRQRFELRPLLVVWNWSLAAFSVVCASRMLPDLLYVWRHHGFRMTVCDDTIMVEMVAINYWGYLFALSKGVELLDTAFVVLRKHPLTNLHWVHHALTFLVTFYLGSHDFGAGRWYSADNLVVHSIMYTYFALKAMRVRLPEAVAKAITLLQLIQMVVGIVITGAVLGYHWENTPCLGTTFGMCLSTGIMYAVYLVLFLNFYRQRYRASSEKAKLRTE